MTVRFVALSGFLGAGKTTAMLAAAKQLETTGHRVAIITNDQADGLVDTAIAGRQTSSVGEVSGGCFCCRFEDLMDTVTKLIDRDGADTVIAESVGSCTDLQATVVRPLMSLYADSFTVAPLTTLVDPARAVAFAKAYAAGNETDLIYLFRQQLLDAEVVILNKTDLYPADLIERARQAILDMAPGRPILDLSAHDGSGLDAVLDTWTRTAAVGSDLDIDYDRYAAAEADLAWCNTTANLIATRGLDLTAWTRDLLEAISTTSESAGYTIGHVKVFATSGDHVVKGAVTASGDTPSIDHDTTDGTVSAATATVNARIAAPPAEMDAMMSTLLAEVSAQHGAGVELAPLASFKPGYPNPIHRLDAASMATASGL